MQASLTCSVRAFTMPDLVEGGLQELRMCVCKEPPIMHSIDTSTRKIRSACNQICIQYWMCLVGQLEAGAIP